MLNAVPSFASKWASHEADQEDYVARFPEEALSPQEAERDFLSTLAGHLGENTAKGQHTEELTWLFATLEPILAEADRQLWTDLTIGFFEDVIMSIESSGGSAAGIHAYTTGRATAHAWRAAYEYLHPPGETPDGEPR
jgi:hypothetical protein